ncbi:transcriptional regulator, TetR family [Pseudonocardia thermophila]|uniref:Transcriptional regulator, TetR family n=1 Tax=Pseudonocardia thermophila TaxID=1848 RepID=A0A1M6U5M8_PSETH|nr:TetR/AcrR family transcriptional regulator [Pseudonocardia thermophila]SHK64459.1 transcriptional regulator, TetR family [Pseudonocardia thermophila]
MEQLGPEAISDARAQWRRRQIVDAASRLLERTDFHSMSMQELAKEAGVSVGLIYQYVPSKEDVLLLLFLDILEAYRREVPEAMAGVEDLVERLVAGFRAYSTVMAERRFLTVLGYRESKSLDVAGRRRTQELEVETIELLAATVREGIEAGMFIEVNAELIAYDLVALAQSWALKYWFLHKRFTFESYVTHQLQLFLTAIFTEQGAREYPQYVIGAPITEE